MILENHLQKFKVFWGEKNISNVPNAKYFLPQRDQNMPSGIFWLTPACWGSKMSEVTKNWYKDIYDFFSQKCEYTYPKSLLRNMHRPSYRDHQAWGA